MKLKKNMIFFYTERSMQTKKGLLEIRVEEVAKNARVIVNAYRQRKKIVWFGSDWSAADAQSRMQTG